MPEPIEYASPNAYVAPRRYRPVAVVTFIMGVASVILYGFFFVSTLQEMHQAKLQHLKQRGDAYLNEFKTGHDTNVELAAIFVVSFASAIVLIAGAALLFRSDSHGVMLHRIYAVVQLILSVLIAAVAMNDIYNSPAGMVFYFGLIPGAIAAICPIGVLVLLAGISRGSSATIHSTATE